MDKPAIQRSDLSGIRQEIDSIDEQIVIPRVEPLQLLEVVAVVENAVFLDRSEPTRIAACFHDEGRGQVVEQFRNQQNPLLAIGVFQNARWQRDRGG